MFSTSSLLSLPCLYLPPVSWFSTVLHAKNHGFIGGNSIEIGIEACENFQKQTLRNRCYIDSPNGKLALSLPIDKSNFTAGGKCLMRDVRISSQLDWRHQHWHALESSYYNSPFFEYLQDDFRPIYEREWTYLMDLNEALIEKCLELLDIDAQIKRTTDYQGTPQPTNHKPQPYYQVFAKKHGFIEDLSIIDLIFNMGNEAVLYL